MVNRSIDQSIHWCLLSWRKKVQLWQLRPTDFPTEFFQIGAFFIYEPDLAGHQTLHFRVKYLRRARELLQVSELFGAFLLHQIDLLADGRGWTFVVDFAECGLQNADFDLFRHIVWLLKSHFPTSLAYILVVDLPWMLRTFWSLLARCIPQHDRHLLRLTTRKEIHKFIASDCLPNYLGGKCGRPYSGAQLVPNGCSPVIQYAKRVLGLSDATCNKLMEIYKPCLEELEQLQTGGFR